MPAPTASATTATTRGLLMPSLRPMLRLMPVFSTEATATLATPPTPMAATATGATAMPPPTPTAPTPPTPTPTATATPPSTAATATTTARGLLTPSPRLRLMPLFCTEVSATATPAGNLPHPSVHIRGHHIRAGCRGVGEWSGIQQKAARAKI